MRRASLKAAVSLVQLRMSSPVDQPTVSVTSPNKIGRYHLKTHVGEGGFSNIRLAVDDLGRTYACKIVPKRRLSECNVTALIQREVSILSSLDHPGIVKLYEVAEDALNYYLITEFCEGENLFQFIKRNGRLDELTARKIFRQICEAVRYVHHKKFAHKDLKPENIIVNSRLEIKLLDFGLSEPCDGLCSSKCGSCCYQSPEVLQDMAFDAQKADMWALGVTLYGMMFAHLPWTRRSRNEIIEQIKECQFFIPLSVSDLCKEVLNGLMNKNVDERWTIDQLMQCEWLQNVPTVEVREQLPRVPPRKRGSCTLPGVPFLDSEDEPEDVKEMLKVARRKLPSAGRVILSGRTCLLPMRRQKSINSIPSLARTQSDRADF